MLKKILFLFIVFDYPVILAGQITFGDGLLIKETQFHMRYIAHTADPDGDGDRDVIFSSSSDGIVWLENAGSGVFTTEHVITSELFLSRPQTIYTIDPDGNGDEDLLIACDFDDKIFWLENDGSGVFNDQHNISSVGQGIISLDIIDLDNDGDTDILSAHHRDNTIGWYENDGEGVYSNLHVISNAADSVVAVHAADLDGDEDPDVLCSCEGDHIVAWYENNGTGTFSQQNIIATGEHGAQYIYSADLDGDGDHDVVAVWNEDYEIVWYENDGSGIFTFEHIITTEATNLQPVFIIDLDRDGDQDFIPLFSATDPWALFDFVWFENDGEGAFSKNMIEGFPSPFYIYPDDLDSDGDIDLLFATDTGLLWFDNLLIADDSRWDLRMIEEALMWNPLLKNYLYADHAFYWQERKQALQSVIDNYPESRWADDAALMLAGGQASIEGDVEGAIAAVQKVIQDYPSESTIIVYWDPMADCRINLAWLYWAPSLVSLNEDNTVKNTHPFDHDGKIGVLENEALAYFNQLEAYPNWTKDVAQCIMGQLLGFQGDVNGAVSAFQKVCDAYQGSTGIADRIAAAKTNGYQIEAEPPGDVVPIFRVHNVAYHQLVSLHLSQGDQTTALEKSLEWASTSSPDGWYWDINRYVGKICEEQKEWEPAEEQYVLCLQNLYQRVWRRAERFGILYKAGNAIKSTDFRSWEDEALKWFGPWINDMEIKLSEVRSHLPVDGAAVNPIVPDFQVSESGSAIQSSPPDISVDSRGNCIVVWMDERNGNDDIYAQRYSSDGTIAGANFKVNDDPGGVNHGNPDVSGNFVITWEDGRSGDHLDLYAQRFSHDGTVLGENFKVNDIPGKGCHIFPAVASDGDSSFIIVWNDCRSEHFLNSDIYAQRYSSDGSASGNNVRINDDQGDSFQSSPAISMNIRSQYVIAWYDERDEHAEIYAQRFSSNGEPLGGNFKVNDDLEKAYRANVAIANDNSGNFVIVWFDNRNGNLDIYAQRYSSDGSALGSNFRVNDDEGSADQYGNAVSIDGQGNFIIVWSDTRNGDSDIYAQRYLSDGTKMGGNFRATCSRDKYQGYPDVQLWNNRIYLTWVDNRRIDQGYDIRANVLDWSDPVAVSNDVDRNHLPDAYQLLQNYPNPSNPNTTIQYYLQEPGLVKIRIFDILGREVQLLMDRHQESGTHQVFWNGLNNQGMRVASGIYIYTLEVEGKKVLARKLMVLK